MDKGISKIYCGHYPYVKKTYDKFYITDMRKLAEELDKGTAPEGKPYPIKVWIGGDNPMITTLSSASIVYDPAFLKWEDTFVKVQIARNKAVKLKINERDGNGLLKHLICVSL